MRVRFTERDGRVLAKMVPARWLTARQIHRLFFPAASLSAARRRLRKLVGARYLHAYREHRMTEALYALGPKGEAFLEEKGLVIRRERTPRKQLVHFVGINDLRIAVEGSSRSVGYFFAAWELPTLGWGAPLIPDAVFAVDDGKRKTFLAEYDRSTEPVRLFTRKLRHYQEGVEGIRFDAVLVLTKTSERILSLRRHLRGHGLPRGRYFAIPLAEILDGDLWSKAFVDLAEIESDHGSTKCSHRVFPRGNSFE